MGDPAQEDLVGITADHVARLEASDTDGAWNAFGMPHIVLTTIGRRSGELRKVALATWTEPTGHRIVAGTAAGRHTHPAWFLNLRDRTEPEVHCRVQGRSFWSVPEIVEGAERDRLWEMLIADRPFFKDYQETIERTIPLVRLPETRPA